jgi:hypothetical protein
MAIDRDTFQSNEDEVSGVAKLQCLKLWKKVGRRPAPNNDIIVTIVLLPGKK